MIPWHPQVKIVKEQTDVFMVYKPCGVLSHPNKPGFCRQSLIQASYNFSDQAYPTSEGLMYLLNRLDGPTSGLVVLCKDPVLTQKIRRLFREHKVKKIYQAIVKGQFVGKDVCWHDKLQIEKSNQHLRTFRVSNNGGISAKTIVNPIQTFNLHGEVFSLIQLEPLTGRTHQLRVQCAQHHFPILGDKTYGDFKCNRRWKTERLFLHACSIEFVLEDKIFVGFCDSEFSSYIQRNPLQVFDA
jgi:Pseudouridylate synthases, 23S RNA-specific